MVLRPHQYLGEALGEGFHQLEMRFPGELLHSLGQRGIVQRQGEIVARGGRTVVPAQGQVQAQALTDAALPVVHADDGIDLQAFDKNSVHFATRSKGCHDKRAPPR